MYMYILHILGVCFFKARRYCVTAASGGSESWKMTSMFLKCGASFKCWVHRSLSWAAPFAIRELYATWGGVWETCSPEKLFEERLATFEKASRNGGCIGPTSAPCRPYPPRPLGGLSASTSSRARRNLYAIASRSGVCDVSFEILDIHIKSIWKQQLLISNLTFFCRAVFLISDFKSPSKLINL